MPLTSSPYEPPLWLRGGHLQTLYPSLVRTVDFVYDHRTRIDASEGDFLDLDWHRQGHDRVAILSHGLEGSTQRSYMRGMARALARQGWDVLAWNLRGCSGTPNRCLRTYHSGATEDLAIVVDHALTAGYASAALVGFSLGGNLTLKYLGERGPAVDARIRSAVALSVPVDLSSSARQLGRLSNWHYVQYFLRTLRAKVEEKVDRWPDRIAAPAWGEVRTLTDFDDRYTAPLNGFRDAADYYQKASSKPFLDHITVPTLLVNAANDPFLAPPCYPRALATDHPHFTLDVPVEGGHVGFTRIDSDGVYWSEQRAVSFLENHVPASPAQTAPVG
jgi:hypothetical protein